jgi:hypothetical protein
MIEAYFFCKKRKKKFTWFLTILKTSSNNNVDMNSLNIEMLDLITLYIYITISISRNWTSKYSKSN